MSLRHLQDGVDLRAALQTRDELQVEAVVLGIVVAAAVAPLPAGCRARRVRTVQLDEDSLLRDPGRVRRVERRIVGAELAILVPPRSRAGASASGSGPSSSACAATYEERPAAFALWYRAPVVLTGTSSAAAGILADTENLSRKCGTWRRPHHRHRRCAPGRVLTRRDLEPGGSFVAHRRAAPLGHP